MLRTLGTGAPLVGAVRASRQIVVPLWAAHIGLDAQSTSIIFGVSGAVDMLLLYPAGSVLDRFGRKWVAVPSMFVLGLARLLLPLTHSVTSLTAVALLRGVGNGLGAGVIMTLGADASPPVGRAQFLGAFRLFADAGSGAGPFMIAAVTALAGLGPAVLFIGLVGWSGNRDEPVGPASPASAGVTDLVVVSGAVTLEPAEDRWSLLPEQLKVHNSWTARVGDKSVRELFHALAPAQGRFRFSGSLAGAARTAQPC